MTSMFGKMATVMNRVPIPYVSGGSDTSRHIPVSGKNSRTAQLEAFGSVGTLFAIVDRLAESVSRVPWRLYRKAPSGKKEDRTEVVNHLALHLWNRPNRFFTQNEFQETIQQHNELTGEMWWVIEKGPGNIPIGIWPVRPDRMEPVPSKRDFLAGYIYCGPDGEQIPLGLDEVIFGRKPNPLDPYRGLGAVQSILTDLDAATMSAQWVRSFFRNSAQPGGLIEVDKRLGEEEFNELRDRWAEQHRGANRAHRVAILEQGKWVERKYSMSDMQFVEIRNTGREMIREAFGFPKPLLGTVDDVNRANADAAEVMFARWLVVPRLDRHKSTLNTYFLPLFGKDAANNLEFDYDNPIPPNQQTELQDRQSKAISARQLVEAGYDPADVAEAVGLPDMAYVGPPNRGGESNDIDQNPRPVEDDQ